MNLEKNLQMLQNKGLENFTDINYKWLKMGESKVPALGGGLGMG